MPRTFTLAGLMLGVTLLAIACGLAVNYPDAALVYAVISCSLIPTAIVCLTLVSFARHRKAVLAMSLLGAGLVGTCCSPVPMMPLRGDPTRAWTYVRPLILPLAILPTLGSLVFGGALLADELLHSRSRSDQPPP